MEVATIMPAAKISIPQQQVLDTLARAGGVMAHRHLISAVWRATSSTVSSLIKRDLLIGDGPGAYPAIVQLTPDGWAHTPTVPPGTMEAAVWDEAAWQHEQRYPTPQTVSVEVPVQGYRPLTVSNDGPRVTLTTYTTGPIVFTREELQNLDDAIGLARYAASTHRAPRTLRPAPKVVS